MSQHSLLNIQEISSRTFHNESAMERSVDPLEHHNTSIVNHIIKAPVRHLQTSSEELLQRQKQQFERFKNEVLKNSINARNSQRGEDLVQYYDDQVHKLMEVMSKMNEENGQLRQNYHNAIRDLKQTLHKNELMHNEIDRLRKKISKLQQTQLNYSRDQNVISSLAKAKSNYEIELINMKDSLLIMDKQKKEIQETNEQYQQKLALLSQEIQRLRGMLERSKEENQKLRTASQEFQQHIKRQQFQFLQRKPLLEKLRIQNKDLTNSNNKLTTQLQEYHQKLLFKERQVNDLQEKQHKHQHIIRTRQSQIQQLQLRTQTLLKSTRNIEEESQFRDNNLKQELQRIRRSFIQSQKAKERLQVQKERLTREYHQHQLKFQMLQEEVQIIERQKEATIHDLEKNVREKADSRIIALTNQLQRVTSFSKDREAEIQEFSNKQKQAIIALEEKSREVQYLKEVNEKLNLNVGRAQQAKGNFKVLMSEIERLNQVVCGKDGQIKSQRMQIAKLIQKIQLVYQQQIKIIKIIENTYVDDAKRDVQFNNQLTDLREYIGKLNQGTNFTLQDIFQQGGNIINYLTKNESDLKIKIQDQTNHYQTLIAQRDQQILYLKQDIDNYRIEAKKKMEDEQKEEEIYQKLVELTRQNAAIKQQIAMNSNSYEAQISGKEESIIQLQSKIKEIQKLQKKQVQSLQQYIAQMQKNDSETHQATLRFKHQIELKDAEISRIIAEKNRVMEEKEVIIRQLTAQNKELEGRLLQIPREIDAKLQQIKRLSEQVSPTKEFQRYKLQIRKYQEELQKYRIQQLDEGRLTAQEKQIEKLQKIVQIRNIQIQNNEQSYLKLKYKQEKTESQLLACKNMLTQMQENQESSSRYEHQVKQLEEETSRSSAQNRAVSDLKDKNMHLERELRMLQGNLKDSEYKLSISNKHIDKLKLELQRLLEYNTKSINKIQSFQISSSEKHQLQQRVHDLEDELQRVSGRLRQVQIDYHFIKGNQQQKNMHLQAYENKSSELQRQCLKLREALNNLNSQYYKLNTRNHYFQIEMKKADILQSKIQVLNREINRLSYENMSLSQEVTSCKLALGGQLGMQRKCQQHLCLIVLLSTEIQSLRGRLKQSQQQLNSSRFQQLSRYRY